MVGVAIKLFNRQFLEKRNPFLFIYGVKIIYAALVGALIGVLAPSAFDIPIDDERGWSKFLITVIIGPIIETLINQVIVIEILRSFKIKNTYIILISALLFSLSHGYNIIYMLATFIPGIIYAAYYTKLRQHNGWIYSTAFVFCLHSLYNFFVFLMDLL